MLGRSDALCLGRSPFDAPVTIALSDRLRHLYLVGQTGTGKSTLISNLIVQDLHARHGVGLIDPHGDLATQLLAEIPPRRHEDVVWFDPGDARHPPAFNLLGCLLDAAGGNADLATSAIVAAFSSIWGNSWGPRLEYILANATRTLLEVDASPQPTLLALPRLLTDTLYRDRLVRRLHDPLLHQFWENEFDAWDKRYRQEAIAPVLNKVGRLLQNRLLRNVLGQPRVRWQPRELMDEGGILLANLSIGRLGADASGLLSALLVSAFHLAAMGRANVDASRRRPFFLYVDEFQHAATASFSSILSESRKYGLGLTLAHQYLAQADPRVLDAVFGNVGSLLTFRVGEIDAPQIAKAIGHYPPSHFSLLNNHEAIARVLIDGQPTKPESLAMHRPIRTGTGRPKRIIRRSRQRHGLPRPSIERNLRRWYDPK
ncbi:MAG: type IV secretion system DNA-binding domain-containing protein [Planctomycetota bacterium]